MAQTSTQSSAVSSPTTISSAANQGNNQAINFNSPGGVNYSGSYTLQNVPSVNAPNLTSSFDSCMGSNSASVNIAGFGIGGGGTYTDESCKRIKLSRELWNMGLKAASVAMLCNDPEAKEALEDTGYKCPVKKVTAESTKTANTRTSSFETMYIGN